MTSTTSHDESALANMRVLVVEDSYLIAASLRRLLNEMGCRVVGPVGSVGAALQAIEREGCDAAILDVNLGSETSLPIAEILDEKNTPYFFVTGYSSPALGGIEFKSRRRLRKPLTDAALKDAMLEDFIREG